MKKSIFDLSKKEFLEVSREFEKTKYYGKNTTLTNVSLMIGSLVLGMCALVITLCVYITINSTINEPVFSYIILLWGIVIVNISTILVYSSNSRNFKMLKNYYDGKNEK